jgi:glutamyl-tRNA reductase
VELRELYVLHWRGAHVACGAVPESRSGLDVFLIDTCQRRVALARGREELLRARAEFPADGTLESFEGVEAYAFLLRFACGLESKLVAETEIFGQIKDAWRQFSERGTPLARQLSPWMQLLFQDAKAIRAQYLGHLGSASYGSQVRRLLGAAADEAEGAEARGPTLLIGAGQLAQSVAPWLTGGELWLWNRTPERALELARELGKRSSRPVRVLESSAQAELEAWRSAQNVVVCIPSDPGRDAARVSAWRQRAAAAGQARVVHLGLGADSIAPWSELPELVSLGSLFDMLRAQSEQRSRQLQRARRACQEKGMLRALGSGSSHSHSWEDLAAFHCV